LRLIVALLCLQICHLHSRRRIMEALLVACSTMLREMSFPKIRQYHKIIGLNKLRRICKKHERHQSPRQQGSILKFDVFEETGIYEDMFEEIFGKIRYQITTSRRDTGRKSQTVLTPRVRLLMVLHWLCDHPRWSQLAKKFGVSRSVAYRDARWILPKLYVCVQGEIAWPKALPFGWEGVSGAIDGTAHPRSRVHPRQADWYRADKGFNMMAQVIVGLDGKIYETTLLMGHNNDAGAFNLTGVREFIEQHQIRLLADLGYSHYLLVTPEKYMPQNWKNKQKALRSIVEVVIGFVKNWRVTAEDFFGSSELQSMALMICYQLTAKRLKKSPIRETPTQTFELEIPNNKINPITD
jgi:hypothetical protein